MATIGLDGLYYAPITEDASGIETYGTPVKLAKAISAELSIELVEAILDADDGVAYSIKEFNSGKLTLGVDDIGSAAASTLTGATIDSNKVVVYCGEDSPPPVAIGFRALRPGGTYRYFWLYRVVFGVPTTTLATKARGAITFQTPTIEGTVMRRNKLDSRNKHPWKSDLTEGDTGVEASTITGWFSGVYEPMFSAGEPEVEG